MQNSDINDKINYIHKILCDPGWKHSAQYDDTIIEHMFIDNSPFVCVRSQGFIKMQPLNLLNYIWNCTNFKSMKKIYPNTILFDIIDVPNDDTKVCYQINKNPLIAARDSVYIQTKLKIDKSYYVVAYSINSNKAPVNKDCVRTIINISAFILTPENDGTRISYILHADPGGLIPAFIVNNYINEHIMMMIKHIKRI